MLIQFKKRILSEAWKFIPTKGYGEITLQQGHLFRTFRHEK